MRDVTPGFSESAKRPIFWFILVTLIGWDGINASANNPARGTSKVVQEDSAGSAMIKEAQAVIAAYHKDQTNPGHTLRIVYFIPKDREPLPHYAERLDRVMNDVSHFYRDGLRRFGVETSGIPLERKDGKLVLHLVRGRLPTSEYNYEAGKVVFEEVRQALKEIPNLNREYLLVLYAACRRETNGSYVFGTPYNGLGTQRGGGCHAADCEWLDPLLLMETNRFIAFGGKNQPPLRKTVAEFNSIYIGGVAHELGHGLSLPHDNGGSAEEVFGVSLMGTGNRTYRREIWGGGSPTYLGRVSALQFISHPLITGSDRGRWDDPESSFESLEISQTNRTLRIRGVVTSTIPAYAVNAYVWVDDDHYARTSPCLLKKGVFEIEFKDLDPNVRNLRLATLHVNGAAVIENLPLPYDESARVVRAENAVMRRQINAHFLVNDEAIAAMSIPEVKRQLRALRAVLEPPVPFDLAKVSEDSAFLSDAEWVEAKVGWGQVARNHYWFDQQIQNGVFLMLGGKFYDKGLYAHSPSRYSFSLDGRWKNFTAVVGLRDNARARGAAVFTVRGDGRELYRSGILRAGNREEVKVNIGDVKQLELLAEGGEGHNANSWAIWVDPKVTR